MLMQNKAMIIFVFVRVRIEFKNFKRKVSLVIQFLIYFENKNEIKILNVSTYFINNKSLVLLRKTIPNQNFAHFL